MENLMTGSGKKTKCMDMVFSHGKMVRNMKDSLSMIREKDKVSSTGKMEESMMVCGKMENNMEGVHLQQKMEIREQVNGTKVEKQSGYLDSLNKLIIMSLALYQFYH